VRRIVALTGDAAAASRKLEADLEQAVKQAGGIEGPDLSAAIQSVQKQSAAEGVPLLARRRANQAIVELQAKQKAFEKEQKKASVTQIDVSQTATDLIAKAGGKAIVTRIDNLDNEQMLGLLDSVRSRSPTYAFLLASVALGKVQLLCAVSDDVIAKGLKAGDWIRDVAKATGGGGGGRPSLAQAGGKDPTRLGEALTAASRQAADILNA